MSYIKVLIAILVSLNYCLAEIRLPKHISDGMVIQRNSEVMIRGWAEAGERIKINFKGRNYSSIADIDGKWNVMLTPSREGGPLEMKITGKNCKITIKDILVGDVWICAGQSNMVHYLELHQDRYQEDIAAAHYPEIRQFLVPSNPVLSGPSDDLPDGTWKPANPENVMRFSVVAYFFAKNLYDKYRVPIGLINASIGGTSIEAWTSEKGLLDFPHFQAIITQNKDTAYVNSVNREAFVKMQGIPPYPEDAGLAGEIPWSSPDFIPANWETMNIPGYWEDQGIRDLDGSIWFRRNIQLPESMTGKPGRIHMGRIIDADQVYINGVLVGGRTYQYPQRRYDFESGILKPGKNTVVVRVQNYSGKGGFVPDKPYYLAVGKDTIDLKGDWLYKVGAIYPRRPRMPRSINAQDQPSALFNGMISPFAGYPVKGILWYQGESNASRPEEYEILLPAFIRDWRNHWKNDNLPFIFAQLPNYMEVNYLPEDTDWARLRESQRKALKISNTAMVVTIDLGEWNDIHPGNKKPIGNRMAFAAQKLAYGEKAIVYSGPLYSSYTVEDSKALLHFEHQGSGLISSDGEDLRWFTIAGEDKKFVPAHAEIKGDWLVVWSDEIDYPMYVRYAWSDNPARVNFYNKEGLPASPFEAKLFDESARWHGKKAAVVLTYDDGLDVHLDHAIPALDAHGFKGTFYITSSFPGFSNRTRDWAIAAKNGHELGNHTLFHPCDASKPGRDWVNEDNDLSKNSVAQIVRDVEMTNTILNLVDGQKERTFAYTCGDTDVGNGSFIEAIGPMFVAMRGVRNEVNSPASLDFSNLNCFMVDEGNADHLINWAEKAANENAMLVVLFHGVGGGHNINVSLEQHNAFLDYLKDHQQDYWVTTLLDASKNALEIIHQK